MTLGGHNISNVRYVDYTVLTAENEHDLQNLVDPVIVHSKQLGLELNSKETEIMIIPKKKDIPQCNIHGNWEILKTSIDTVMLEQL